MENGGVGFMTDALYLFIMGIASGRVNIEIARVYRSA